MSSIKLKKSKEESLLRRHPWIFSGAIHSAQGEIEEGDIVDVYSSGGEFLAKGHSAVGSIAVRVLSFEDVEIDQAWWNERVEKAFALRRTLGFPNRESDCYRLIHGEGDLLPGLIVDIYGSTAVMQCHSVGMYLEREKISEALKLSMGDALAAIYDKSSKTLPPKCGIDSIDSYLYRIEGYDHRVVVLENGNKFEANWEEGQKTGFFLDQRDNRALVGRYSGGRRVLNTFCYTGGFSVYALSSGALSCDSVDSSEKAIRLCTKNVELNNPTVEHNEYAVDAMEYLRDMDHGAYDLIILDPPAFAKHHKVLGNALQGYKRLNARAIEKISAGGILFTFSCSQAVSSSQFRT
ncbi:MAG: class I SAM-dependent rRNA methyltransferase, partial [Rikenellaceae bacterium]